jgi:hypothetical protein
MKLCKKKLYNPTTLSKSAPCHHGTVQELSKKTKTIRMRLFFLLRNIHMMKVNSRTSPPQCDFLLKTSRKYLTTNVLRRLVFEIHATGHQPVKMPQLQLWNESRGEAHAISHDSWDSRGGQLIFKCSHRCGKWEVKFAPPYKTKKFGCSIENLKILKYTVWTSFFSKHVYFDYSVTTAIRRK